MHAALTAPESYLNRGGRTAGAGGRRAAAAAAAAGAATGTDDAGILYRLLLQADEAPPAADLLARFARAHGHEIVASDCVRAGAAAGAERARTAKRGRRPGVFLAPGHEVPAPSAAATASAALDAAAAAAAGGRRAPTPIPEVIARFNRALGELAMAGLVGRARRPGTVRRAVFPPPGLAV